MHAAGRAHHRRAVDLRRNHLWVLRQIWRVKFESLMALADACSARGCDVGVSDRAQPPRSSRNCGSRASGSKPERMRIRVGQSKLFDEVVPNTGDAGGQGLRGLRESREGRRLPAAVAAGALLPQPRPLHRQGKLARLWWWWGGTGEGPEEMEGWRAQGADDGAGGARHDEA